MNLSTMANESAELLYNASNAQALGFELFEAAMRGEVALSDFVGCFDLLIGAHPNLYFNVVSAAHRLEPFPLRLDHRHHSLLRRGSCGIRLS